VWIHIYGFQYFQFPTRREPTKNIPLSFNDWSVCFNVVGYDAVIIRSPCLWFFSICPFSTCLVPVFFLNNQSFDVHFCYMHVSQALIPFQNFILFGSIHYFLIIFSLRNTLTFILGQNTALHGMALTCHIKRSIKTIIWTHGCFLIQKFTFFVSKCWILLKPVMGCVKSKFQFPIPSLNRSNQIWKWTKKAGI
jgi:hypothetical protein